MRADRLLSLLILLQSRGRITARKLAQELEVSERTIYRDIEALSAAGVPVYAERGPGGGCALLESYRTSLTGLKEEEVRALFMLRVPAPLAQLGVQHELKAALLKLAASLPASRRLEEERVRQRIHLDAVPWHSSEEPVPHLQIIQQAVFQDRRLFITYQPIFRTKVERLVDPYGLVAKADRWYLAAARNGRVRIYRISEILEARLSVQTFERPAGFDLADFWASQCSEREHQHISYPVVLRVAPELIPELPRLFGSRIRHQLECAGPPDAKGWLTLTLEFASLPAARARLLGFGGAVEVLKPQALRLSIADFAEQIVNLYKN